MSHLVFVYGSSLDTPSVVAFAESLGVDPAVLHPGTRAWLPDCAPAFDHEAAGTAGLGFVAARGRTLAGMLMRLEGSIDWLDAKEGVPSGLRERTTRDVLTEDGRTHRAAVYQTPEAARKPFVAPRPETVDQLARALVRCGHDASPIRAAALGRKPSTEPSSVFVYGTLRKGECRADVIDRHDPFEGGKGVVHGSVAGRLVDLGEYPGLLVGEDRTKRVHGEVYTFADLDEVFGDLDAIEGFNGYDGEDGEYRRCIVRVDLDARERICWTYVFCGDASGKPVIESGDWLRRTRASVQVSGAVA